MSVRSHTSTSKNINLKNFIKYKMYDLQGITSKNVIVILYQGCKFVTHGVLKSSPQKLNINCNFSEILS